MEICTLLGHAWFIYPFVLECISYMLESRPTHMEKNKGSKAYDVSMVE